MNEYTITQRVMDINQKYLKWFKQNPNEWRKDVEKLIIEASNGEIRAFQLFYNSPEEALSGSFQYQVLEKKDLSGMYPKFYSDVNKVGENSYMYIFCCNGAISPSKALISQTIISFES